MQTPADIFRATMARLFENPDSMGEDDIYFSVFPEHLKTAMLQCRDVENARRRAARLPPLALDQCLVRYSPRDVSPLPFSDMIASLCFPLFIASECLRDAGQNDLSAYFREQFVT